MPTDYCICRTCGTRAPKDNMESIYGSLDVSQKFKKLLPLNLVLDRRLSDFMCKPCVMELNLTHEFIEKALGMQKQQLDEIFKAEKESKPEEPEAKIASPELEAKPESPDVVMIEDDTPEEPEPQKPVSPPPPPKPQLKLKPISALMSVQPTTVTSTTPLLSALVRPTNQISHTLLNCNGCGEFFFNAAELNIHKLGCPTSRPSTSTTNLQVVKPMQRAPNLQQAVATTLQRLAPVSQPSETPQQPLSGAGIKVYLNNPRITINHSPPPLQRQIPTTSQPAPFPVTPRPGSIILQQASTSSDITTVFNVPADTVIPRMEQTRHDSDNGIEVVDVISMPKVISSFSLAPQPQATPGPSLVQATTQTNLTAVSTRVATVLNPASSPSHSGPQDPIILRHSPQLTIPPRSTPPPAQQVHPPAQPSPAPALNQSVTPITQPTPSESPSVKINRSANVKALMALWKNPDMEFCNLFSTAEKCEALFAECLNNICQCSSCRMVFMNRTDYNQHMVKSVQDRTYHRFFPCHACKTNFPTAQQLREHHSMGLHGNVREQYACGLCPLFSSREDNVVKHILRAHCFCPHCHSYLQRVRSELMVKQDLNYLDARHCPTCKLLINKHAELAMLACRKADPSQRIFICNFCSVSFQTRKQLSNHFMANHIASLQDKFQPFEAPNYEPCYKLYKMNNQAGSDDEDAQPVGTLTPLKGPARFDSGARTSTESVEAAKIDSASRGERSSIESSGNVSTESDDVQVKEEVKVDSEPKSKTVQYCCLDCPASFTQFSFLLSHMQTEHQKSDSFQCDKCNRKFGKREALDAHVCQRLQGQPLIKLVKIEHMIE